MSTNDPRRAALADYSDHQLLVLILTELRLNTYLAFQREVQESELDGLRALVMNDVMTVDDDVSTNLTQFPNQL